MTTPVTVFVASTAGTSTPAGVAETSTAAATTSPTAAPCATIEVPVAAETAVGDAAPSARAVVIRPTATPAVATPLNMAPAAPPTAPGSRTVAGTTPHSSSVVPRGLSATGPAASVPSYVAASTRTPIATGSVPSGATVVMTATPGTATSPTAVVDEAATGPATQDTVFASPPVCVDTAVTTATASDVPGGATGFVSSLAVPTLKFSVPPGTSSPACVPRVATDVPVVVGTATGTPAESVPPAVTGNVAAAQGDWAAVPPSAASAVATTGPRLPRTAEAAVYTGTALSPRTMEVVPPAASAVPSTLSPASHTLNMSQLAIRSERGTTETAPDSSTTAVVVVPMRDAVNESVRNASTSGPAVPALPPPPVYDTTPVVAAATADMTASERRPEAGALPIAASSVTTTPTSMSTGIAAVSAGRGPSSLATAPLGHVPRTVPSPVPAAGAPGTEVTSRSTDGHPVPDEDACTASVGDDAQLLYEDDLDEIVPCSDSGVLSDAPELFEEQGGRGMPSAQATPLAASSDGAGAESEVHEISQSTAPAALGPATNPKDGVYALNEVTRAKISTLLRTLFFVQKSSDKSIMPFLGIVHYLMGFSALVGVVSLDDRSDFFDALLAAFERPVSMKFFMEEAFQCGPQGLHVGGRTRPMRHVAGQPQGLQEDVLRARINKDNVKVQWIARRLCLRLRVNIHPGARSVTGGLSQADRDTIVQSLAGDGVSSKLRERGCVVKYAKVGAVDRKPVSLAFLWDASSTWFPDSLEADLVANLKDVLLKATPIAHKDCDPHKPRQSRTPTRADAKKRLGADDVDAGREDKRPKGDNQISSGRLPPKNPAVGCSRCAELGKTGVSVEPQVVPTALEHWSADVCRSAELPHGGHVLAVALPMDMDAGPGGRQSVKGVLAKSSRTGASPCTYSLFVSCGERVPDAETDVQGAMYTSAGGHDTTTACMSHDILRSVSAHMSRRQPAVGASPGGGRSAGSDGAPTAVRLSVRAAARPTLQTHRFDFTSEFELQTKGELVQRTPGRVIIFWPGIDPVPVGGAFTL